MNLGVELVVILGKSFISLAISRPTLNTFSFFWSCLAPVTRISFTQNNFKGFVKDFETFPTTLRFSGGFWILSQDSLIFPTMWDFFQNCFGNIFWDLWIFSGTFFKLCTDFFELFPGRFCSFHFTVSDYMRNSEALNPKRFIQILSSYWYVFEF